MSSRKPPTPTKAELEILRVLWRLGPSTVREVQEALEHGPAYTTVLKFLQIMTDKALVTRDESGRAHVYEAAVSETATQQRLLSELVDRAFDGSAARLVMQALSSTPASPEEIEEIRRLLDQMKGDMP